MKIFTRLAYISGKYQNEDKFAAATYMYVSQNYPSVRGLFHHVANEYNPIGNAAQAHRDRIKRASIGVMPGVLDFHNPYPQFYIELKHGKGTTSEAQDDFIRKLTHYGIPNAVCWYAFEVTEFIEPILGKPLFP